MFPTSCLSSAKEVPEPTLQDAPFYPEWRMQMLEQYLMLALEKQSCQRFLLDEIGDETGQQGD